MGGVTSRRNGGVEEVDITSNNAYKYPPKSGNYFGSHFIMGGERFETTPPEAYLFGENVDLNFLGNRPTPFPYPAPQAREPTKTLKSLVNIRKDSLRFVKVMEEPTDKPEKEDEDEKDQESAKPNPSYNIEFTFDSDVRCAITIYYFATEEIVNKHLVYHPLDQTMNSETYHYKRGANQVFNQTNHIVTPLKFPEDKWQYNPDTPSVLPVVIHCVVEDEEHIGHSQATLGVVERTSEGGFQLKPLKQKQMVDGLCYLLQEIYGIENKNNENNKEEELDNSGAECVICMCELRDTIILPCRHLCLCNCCADNLRYQANNCPICRAPFRALLQIRAMQKKTGDPVTGSVTTTPATQTETPEEGAVSQLGVPTGFEAVSLIEALNGPNLPTVPNPLHSHADGRSTIRSTRSNASPNVSPALNKRKRVASRKGSRASQCSRSSRLDLRGGGDGDEGDGEDVGAVVTSDNDPDRVITPEIIMSEMAPDPTKSPAATAASKVATTKNKIKYPPSKTVPLSSPEEPTSPEVEPSVDIVNECQRLEVAEAEETSPPDPTIDYEHHDKDFSGSSDEEYDRPCQAHTAVFKTDEDTQLSAVEIGIDPISLPGTPATDDSSYSSTNSTHVLLTTPSEASPTQN